MQQKPSDKSSKRTAKTTTSTFDKGGKKKFASPKKSKSSGAGEKGAAPAKNKGGIPYKKKTTKDPIINEKQAKEFFNKKFLKGKDSAKDKAGIYTTEEKHTDEVRLNKYLSHAGVASRRKADELIKEGKVTVNGVVVTEMGYKVKPKDTVEYMGKVLLFEKKYYLLLNKPKDFITTIKDERDRKTVMDLLRSAFAQIKEKNKPRLYPVGRLDRNTTGVLLITNDGELAQKLTHPSSEITKIYHVVLNKKLRKEDFDKVAEGGVVLEDGIAEVDEIAYPNPNDKAEVGVTIHTGKNRFVRRLFEAMGYQIEKLDRVYFAGLTKKDVPRGKWRFLGEEEVRNLKHFLH